ncbi:MAG: STAS domain-containing protein [Pseudomonadota bacterium]|nr:STAS domain-containing protein [Pseudomonadota bacterium]
MEYRSEFSGDPLVVEIQGVLTFDDHERFRELAAAVADSEAATVVLDLSGLTMIDSAGIGMLIMTNDRVVKRGKTLRLRGVQGQVAKVVELSRIEQLIPVD